MTEAEWLAADDPRAMLGWLTGDPRVRGGTNPPVVQPSVRKLRLFAVACWANSPPRRPVPAWIESLLQLEELAEGKRGAFNPSLVGYVCACVDVDDLLRHLSGLWVGENVSREARQRRKAFAASALRDIFGNLFQPVALPVVAHWSNVYGAGVTYPWLTWNDGTVRKMAKAIYQERRFADMPILADALEDAGCTDEDILRHCRGYQRCHGCVRAGAVCEVCRITDSPGWFPSDPDDPRGYPHGPHSRGCWVIDLLTGRE